MIKRKNMKLGLMAIAIAGILLSSIPVYAANQKVTTITPMETTKEVRDLGWTTYAASERNLTLYKSMNYTSGLTTLTHEFNLRHLWNMSLMAGTYLPVNLTVEYPDTVAPGDNATIRIGVGRLPGYAFMNLTGEHILELWNHFEKYYNGTFIQRQAVLDIYLQAIHQIMVGYMLNFRTPIGSYVREYDNVVRNIGSFNMTLRFLYNNTVNNETSTANVTVSASLSTFLTFDAIIIVNTSVIGNVVVSGSALEHEQNTTLVWNNEGVKDITVKVKDNATENDTISARVQLKYVVNEFKIIFKNVTFGIKVNEVNIESQIDSKINDTALKLWVRERIRNVIRGYINGTHKMMIRVKETVIHHRHNETEPLGTTETNTLVSESPYNELTALSITPSIQVSESTSTGGTGSGETSTGTGGILTRPMGQIAVGISIIAALIVGAYIVVVRRRSNNI